VELPAGLTVPLAVLRICGAELDKAASEILFQVTQVLGFLFYRNLHFRDLDFLRRDLI
jgi:hypothetical protein